MQYDILIVKLVIWLRETKRSRGKSEHRMTECWLTASGGDSKESATENYRYDWLITTDCSKGEKVV